MQEVPLNNVFSLVNEYEALITVFCVPCNKYFNIIRKDIDYIIENNIMLKKDMVCPYCRNTIVNKKIELEMSDI